MRFTLILERARGLVRIRGVALVSKKRVNCFPGRIGSTGLGDRMFSVSFSKSGKMRKAKSRTLSPCGQGRMVQPIQRVNVDLTSSMLAELDTAALELNVSRQAVIKTMVRQALDQHYLVQRARRL